MKQLCKVKKIYAKLKTNRKIHSIAAYIQKDFAIRKKNEFTAKEGQPFFSIIINAICMQSRTILG